MPAKKVRASADALIQQARAASHAPADPPAEALAELGKILAYNDCASATRRVSAQAAIDMLRAHGWTGTSRDGLSALCARRLGRRSYANP